MGGLGSLAPAPLCIRQWRFLNGFLCLSRALMFTTWVSFTFQALIILMNDKHLGKNVLLELKLQGPQYDWIIIFTHSTKPIFSKVLNTTSLFKISRSKNFTLVTRHLCCSPKNILPLPLPHKVFPLSPKSFANPQKIVATLLPKIFYDPTPKYFSATSKCFTTHPQNFLGSTHFLK